MVLQWSPVARLQPWKQQWFGAVALNEIARRCGSLCYCCRGGLVSEGLEVARLFLSDEVPIVLTQVRSTTNS
jgi:hypothetical protein